MERRLSAILAADVVGYSRLMGEDEAGTLSALTRLRKDLLEPLIAAHKRRVVKLMGDGFLVEFQSVVHAVSCAVAWQKDVGSGDFARPLQFRIGVNLGDVSNEERRAAGHRRARVRSPVKHRRRACGRQNLIQTDGDA